MPSGNYYSHICRNRPEHARREERVRASAGAKGWGKNFIMTKDDMGSMMAQPVHASPLGRAHIAPGQPWARLGAIGPSELQRARGRGS
jgi:hypothetical protein